MDLTTLSSLRACRTLKTVVKRKFLSSPIDPFVTPCVSDTQNCGKMQIHQLSGATLSSLRTCRTFKTVVKCKILGCPSDPLVTSCVSDAQNCGKTQILRLTLPSRWLVITWLQAMVIVITKLAKLGPSYKKHRYFSKR